jgi:hypothetical protein
VRSRPKHSKSRKKLFFIISGNLMNIILLLVSNI